VPLIRKSAPYATGVSGPLGLAAGAAATGAAVGLAAAAGDGDGDGDGLAAGEAAGLAAAGFGASVALAAGAAVGAAGVVGAHAVAARATRTSPRGIARTSRRSEVAGRTQDLPGLIVRHGDCDGRVICR
jgi:hypothetical protein